MMRHRLRCAVLFLAALLLWPVVASAQRRPNILMVVSDDYGWLYYHNVIQKLRADLPNFGDSDDNAAKATEDAAHAQWCDPLETDNPAARPSSGTLRTSTCPVCDPGSVLHNGTVPQSTDVDVCTPNLDRLAREGVIFHHAYTAAATCQAARESLWSGIYQRDLGEQARRFACTNGGWATIPEILARPDGNRPDDRYVTFFAGKLDIGTPWQNVFCAGESSGDETIGEGTNLGRIKQFLKSYPTRDGGVWKDKPWFVVWAPKTPHYSYTYPQELLQLYRTTEDHITGPSNICNGPPPCYYVPGTQLGSTSSTLDYYRSVTYLDARVGELVEFLGDLENSDNDPNDGYDAYPLSGWTACAGDGSARCRYKGGTRSPAQKAPYAGFRTNTIIIHTPDQGAGLQNSKGHFSEAGIRNPIIINFTGDPNGTPPIPGTTEQRGNFNDALVASVDIFPTLLDFAGMHPDVRDGFPDARSFKAIATQAPGASPRDLLVLNWRADGDVAAIERSTGYKLYTDTPAPSVAPNMKKAFDLYDPGTPTVKYDDPLEVCQLLGSTGFHCPGTTAPPATTTSRLDGLIDCWLDAVEPLPNVSAPSCANPSYANYNGYQGIKCTTKPQRRGISYPVCDECEPPYDGPTLAHCGGF